MSDHPDRRWKKQHREAGYDQQEWNWEAINADNPILGDYLCADGSRLTIRYLGQGPTGAPELELDWEDGITVTVLDDTVAQAYLDTLGADRAD